MNEGLIGPILHQDDAWLAQNSVLRPSLIKAHLPVTKTATVYQHLGRVYATPGQIHELFTRAVRFGLMVITYKQPWTNRNPKTL